MARGQLPVMESWYIQKQKDGTVRLCGRVFDHPPYADGTGIETGPIIRAAFAPHSDDRVLITKSGTTYLLGKHCETRSPEQCVDLLQSAEIATNWGNNMLKQIMALKMRRDIPTCLKRTSHVPAPS